MSSFSRHLTRSLAAVALLGGLLIVIAGSASPAGASTASSQTFPIEFGKDRVELGSATVTRIAGTDTDTLVVEVTVPDGFDEAHLCVSDQPFTSRIEPGHCEYTIAGPATTGTFEVTIAATGPIYVQLHVAASGETGYIGWQPGNPFHGNVEVPDEEEPFTCPDASEPMTDVNGDGVVDVEDCDFVVVLPEEPVTPNVPATPAEPQAPTGPTEPEIEVEEDVVVPPTVTPTAPTATPETAAPETPAVADTTEVLGSQVTTGTLPRTGAATPSLAALGALLMLTGASLRRVGRGLAQA